MEALPSDTLEGYLVLGELGLDGGIGAVPGVLPAALSASAQDLGLICPASTGGEAAWAQNIEIVAAENILTLINHLKGTQQIAPPEPIMATEREFTLDLKDIKGQESAKRALEVAAAGGHNLNMLCS